MFLPLPWGVVVRPSLSDRNGQKDKKTDRERIKTGTALREEREGEGNFARICRLVD